MADQKLFRLPDVGEGLTEADIVSWHVQPGDRVRVNQIIVEIETAKAVVELPSPYDGVVAQLLIAEGTTAMVGTPIIAVDVAAGNGAAEGGQRAAPGEAGAEAPAAAGGQSPAAAQPAAQGQTAGDGSGSVLVGYGVKASATTRRPRRTRPGSPPSPAPADPAATAAGAPAAPAPSPAPAPAAPGPAAAAAGAPAPASSVAAGTAGSGSFAQQVLAKPPVRKLAKDLGVDLSAVAGTGPAGSVTRDDVQSALRTPGTGEAGRGRAGGAAREERIPVRGVRKHTAQTVSASAFTAPHVTEFLQVDVTETLAATTRLRTLPEFADIRVSPLLLVARALLVAAARHPMINSSWDDAAQEIVVRHYVNLGIAAATDRGLVVPNIKDADSLSLPGLAQALAALAQAARAGKATPADLAGGTITITNVGVFGVDTGTPILPAGEAAILAFGQIRDMPWVHQGQLAIRKVTTLALSFDHRVVDGDLGSAVLRDVGAMLEDPLRMLAWS